ncbi:Npt1/Npt2 family nucleotide transporter [Acidobacteriota bacterium]
MTENRLHKILSQYVEIRSDEALPTLLMFLYFFFITSAAYIIKPVKISYFLNKYSLESLVLPYFLTAVFIGFVVYLNTQLLNRFNRVRVVSFSLVFFSLNLVFFAIFFERSASWVTILFWFWVEIFIITSITQFWMLVNDFYNPRQAKRVVGFLVKGGLLGGIAGALMASILSVRIGAGNLLFICPVFLLLCLSIVGVIGRRIHSSGAEQGSDESHQSKDEGIRKSFKMVLKNRYLVLLSGIMATGIIVTTLIDFQFISVLSGIEPDPNDQTALFANFQLFLLLFSYLLHTFLTNRVLKNFGIRFALLISPIVLFILSIFIFILGSASFLFLWAVLIKASDKGLAHSLNQTVREILYIPIPPEMKYKAKVFIDMFVNKFAKGIAAVILFLILTVIPHDIRPVGIAVIIFLGGWIILNFLITREYVKIVKDNLKIKWEDGDRLVTDKVDLDMTKLVFDTLQSRERSSVLYAMNLFDLVKFDKLNPELKKIVSYKTDEVQACAMDSILDLDGEALGPDVDDALQLEEMSGEIDEIMSLNVYQELMTEKVEKILSGKGEGAETSKMEAAKLLGMMSTTPTVIDGLKKLLQDKSIDVNIYAIESTARHRSRELVPYIINHLRMAATRREASQALIQKGKTILGTLKDYLADEAVDIHIRKPIPNIMATIGTQRSGDYLILELRKRDDDVHQEIIDGLYRLRFKDTTIEFQGGIVRPEIIYVIKQGYQFLIDFHDARTRKKEPEMASQLEQHLARALKHIFQLLSLIHPYDDILRAYQNICEGTKKALDYSIELLDNILQKELKEYLFPLIDDISFEEKVSKCRKGLESLENI